MLFRNIVLHAAAIAMLCMLVSGNAQAQTKAPVNRTATTAPLSINLGSGVPAPASLTRQTFQTAALALNFGNAGAAAAQSKTQKTFQTAALTLDLGGGAAKAPEGQQRQTFTTAALAFNLGGSNAPQATGGQTGRRTFTAAQLVMNFGSQAPAQASASRQTATTQPLVMTLK